MNYGITGVRGVCAHCHTTVVLGAWHMNSLAINEPFACEGCSRELQLLCPKQIKRFKSLDALAALQASTLILTATALVVALVLEWVGIFNVWDQLNVSLLAMLIGLAAVGYARQKRRMTLVLQAIRAQSSAN